MAGSVFMPRASRPEISDLSEAKTLLCPVDGFRERSRALARASTKSVPYSPFAFQFDAVLVRYFHLPSCDALSPAARVLSIVQLVPLD